MTSKKDWEDYFELLNGRKPTPDEVAAALQKGEFEAEQPAAQVSQPQAQVSQAQPSQAAAAPTAAAPAANQEGKFKGFLAWYKDALLHPVNAASRAEQPHFGYAIISYLITVLLSAGIFWNITRRIFAWAKEQQGADTSLINKISDQVTSPIFTTFFITFIFLFLVALPGLFLTAKNGKGFKNLCADYLSWFPAISLIALIGFVYSYIAAMPSTSEWENMLESAFENGNFTPLMNGISSVLLTILPLIAIPSFAIGLTYYKAFQMVIEARIQGQKFDAFWWFIIQIVITVVITMIVMAVIVDPQFSSLGNKIANTISNATSSSSYSY
ncbi:hypothetical protein [Fructobacillus durionis]|uniref:Yip1 domain-containing protein n=1 Tax=Fructobacillus durionis TaxID=283737 RepID=A0A1I1G3N0_9LACO|nr:hypothetical protein [Fructobacillus durionis]SFC05922.1 hypothetical protein SAMN05660453_0958 [Fructobacillus durionis]